MATAKQEKGASKAAAKQTKEGTGIHAPVQPSKELAEVVGSDALLMSAHERRRRRAN